jgi:hypothetical protein
MANPNVIKVVTLGPQGPSGADGADGANGLPGSDGATGPVGEASFEDHGTVSSGTVNIDRTDNTITHKITAGGNFTITLSNFPASGSYGEVALQLVNGGAYTITFPTVTWINDAEPNLQSSGTDFIVFFSTDGGTTVFARSLRGLLTTEDQTIIGGARVTPKSLGTITSGTVTPDPGDRPIQYYNNNGAHVLAPSTNKGSFLLEITNSTAAGAITSTGWTKVDGDPFDTTNTNKFLCSCVVSQSGSLLLVQALQ